MSLRTEAGLFSREVLVKLKYPLWNVANVQRPVVPISKYSPHRRRHAHQQCQKRSITVLDVQETSIAEVVMHGGGRMTGHSETV